MLKTARTVSFIEWSRCQINVKQKVTLTSISNKVRTLNGTVIFNKVNEWLM